MAGQTLAQKIWREHVVRQGSGGEDLLYIDLQILHEVNTPQAFDGLRAAGRSVRRPDLTVGTEDHSTPTISVDKVDADPHRRRQRALIRENCAEFGVPFYALGQPGQGIYAVIAPELGLVQPGMTITCCDSHATTLGAFGALALGIGTTQVEHVLATQTLPVRRPADMLVSLNGSLQPGVTAKDVALALISSAGTSCAIGYIVEYRGSTVADLGVEGRITLCNMSVEFGARAAVMAPDELTYQYLKQYADMLDTDSWGVETEYWKGLRTDSDSLFDKTIEFDVDQLTPYVSWGTNPGQSVPLHGCVPDPASLPDPAERRAAERALRYMALRPGTRMRDVHIEVVFLGSCTNGRIEDLRAAADVLRGQRVSPQVRMVVVPGSVRVRDQAIAEGLDQIFAAAGAEFRPAPGCSMCVSLGEDRLSSGQRAVSTSNRNFEGRQGRGARTHLVSPPVAAASAIAGRIASPADL